MTDFSALLWVHLLYKISLVSFGSLTVYLGYQLFCRGILVAESEVQAKVKDRSFVLRKIAPGTFYAILGASIVALTTWRGFSTDYILTERLNKNLVHYNRGDVPTPSPDGVEPTEIPHTHMRTTTKRDDLAASGDLSAEVNLDDLKRRVRQK